MIRIARRLFLTLCTLALLGWLSACAWLWLRQDTMLFFPSAVPADNRASFAEHAIEFRVGDTTLSGWYLTGETPVTLFYYGGNEVELSARIEALSRLREYGLLLVNYRGYGDSTGAPGEAAMKADALAIFDQASATLDLAPQNIILVGRSLGSGVATHVADARETAGLVLITPYDSVAAVAQGLYPWVPVSLLIRHPFDNLAYLENIDEPTLFIRAETDFVIPHRHTDNLISRWPGTHSVMTLPGNHGSVVNSAEFDLAVRRFIDALRVQDLH